MLPKEMMLEALLECPIIASLQKPELVPDVMICSVRHLP